jgi:hypothetical protein
VHRLQHAQRDVHERKRSSQLMTAITLAQSQEEPSPYEHVLDHRQQVPSRASSRKPDIMFNARSNRAC